MKRQNRLINASSPYLRQHADNPVDWYEWGTEALQRAKKENKPLIISIGYAACHWCHVMAHQSFSNEQIAAYMNEHFVCIKVDREERPDIDQIYMDAAHVITGRGGWPLNAIALPDGRPFYASTYFPPDQWLDVLQQLVAVYETDMPRVLRAAESITNGIQSNALSEIGVEQDFTQEWYHESYKQHISKIDFEFGGYSNAPKFMMPVGLEFFLQYHYFTGDTKALEALTISLDAMACGGLNDQIGGGFARYSTDERWLVPHFEKMLYDNAQLISLYSKAYRETKKTFYLETAEKTIAFVERELLDKNGGFYASIDADSEHEEGKFYVWTKAEIEKICGSDADWIMDFYNISEQGNWECRNILHYTTEKKSFAKQQGFTLKEFETKLTEVNQKLFDARSIRTRPATDDKILCSWNALMISAYVEAYKASQKAKYLKKALDTTEFMLNYLFKNDGSLFRVCKDGKVSVEAFLDDYALLAQALIDLYEVTLDKQYLDVCGKLINYMYAHFINESGNMFYYTPNNAKDLIVRKYEYSDNVIPASNSVLAHVLFRYGTLTENEIYLSTAQSMLKLVMDELAEYGSYYANWAILLGRMVYPQKEVVCTGENAVWNALKLQINYIPDCIFAGGEQENLPLLINRIKPPHSLIYVCRDKTCKLPVENVETALVLIKENPASV
ncbi:MAG: thioredoxin domain-containing protein [Paludibacter sp.]|nr:thioredoxin domain-containing protein [Paludibacter sp.]